MPPAVLIVIFLLFVSVISRAVTAPVTEESVPENGIQPQVVTTTDDVIHLIYLTGDVRAANVRYTHRQGAGPWSNPIAVNSIPGSAIAGGTIRGAQFTLGKDGGIHVLWNGSVPPGGDHMQASLWYARLQSGGPTFTAQQNVLSNSTALDGGASIAATPSGKVAVVWHGLPIGGKKGEAGRLVFMRTSTDDGATFASPVVLNATSPGVCACCSLRAHFDAKGSLTVLFRAARSLDDRPMTLLTVSEDQQPSSQRTLEAWRIAACPMSSASLTNSAVGIRAAWETGGQVRTGILGSDPASWLTIGPDRAKHPSVAINSQGETLITAVGGSGWAKAGKLHWQLLDPSGKPSTSGAGAETPVWSFAAAYALKNGPFVILR